MTTSTVGAPSARDGHTAIWTGTEMLVWGGWDGSITFNTGGRYDPAMDTWTASSLLNAPLGRYHHSAVWTGTEMIVWGGTYYFGKETGELNTGGRYDPATDTWTATSLDGAPSARSGHTAIWTGTEMLVWGTPADKRAWRYNPSTDTWTMGSITNAPSIRYAHSAVWTGMEMIVWGGEYLDT